MPSLTYFALFLPLIGFLALIAIGYQMGRRWTAIVACLTIFISFACFLSLLFFYLQSGMQDFKLTLFHFVPFKAIGADVSFYIDSLSLLMALIITGIGFLIHVYSIGYMEHEEDYARYFAFLNFFIFSMLLLVLSGHLLVLFVGWEGVGLASYLLIGFWYTRPQAAFAATKAFVINRLGDLGFLLALLLTFYLFGTGDIVEISRRAADQFAVGAPIITLLTLLYFIGATGKSAQLPLYSWLPDAMEGPTPVSALIHAATMVTAGVYLIVRLHALFLLSPLTLQIVGGVGVATALFAALCALAQTDLKRVLAFSTVSQLGLMFLACGAGAFYSAMFHLTMHAFVKALLFLSAGNVIHMMHGTTEMAKMGGLSKVFHKTHWLFLIGTLSLAGIPPFAAFFSKELILDQEYLAGYHTLFYIGLAASVLTGIYMTRAYFLTFRGASYMESHQLSEIKEAPKVMLIPVSILALLAVVGGFLGYTFGNAPLLETFLEEIGITAREQELRSGFVLTQETWIAMISSILGVLVTAWIYLKYASQLKESLLFLRKAFYLNEIYHALFVKPLKVAADLIVNFFEPKIFEGSVQGAVSTVQEISRGLQRFQSGQIRSYLAWMVIGSMLLMIYIVGNFWYA